MSVPEDSTPLILTVLGQAAHLVLALTDGLRLARVASIALPDEVLEQLKGELAMPVGDGEAWCRLGGRFAEALIPRPIAEVLAGPFPRGLTLQVDPALAWIPWEFVFDGEQFLGEQMALSRQLVTAFGGTPDTPAVGRQGLLKILVLAGGDEPVQDLVACLRIVDGVAVSGARVADLHADELPRMIANCDVVHFVGPVRGRSDATVRVPSWQDGEPFDVATLVQTSAPPPLLVLQDTAPAAGMHAREALRAVASAACRAGSVVLACSSSGVHEQAVEFLVATYTCVARGEAVAEAVREARVTLHRHAGVGSLAALGPELYGEGARIVFPPSRRPRADDAFRQVTVMCIDLVDSTRLMGEMGTEGYSEMLDAHHARCAELLRARGGMPEDPQGDDGRMCYFGLPFAREDAALQAMWSGFEVLREVQKAGRNVRIGVCTGQVRLRDGHPFGPAVHFAARLQAIATPGTMVVGESTRRIVKDGFRFQPLELVGKLKGFDDPERFHLALGPAARAAMAGGPGAGPGLTPFVGRQSELQALEEQWSAVCTGDKRFVRIVGEAGIGKSRLVREMKCALAARGVKVFELRCAPEHVNSAFHPLIEGLQTLWRGRRAPGHPDVSRRLRALPAGHLLEAEQVAVLADLLGLGLPAGRPELRMSPERRRQATLEALQSMARSFVDDAPACLIVEDVHWIDASSAEILNRVAADPGLKRILILVTARSDADGNWHPRTPLHETELLGLSPALSRSLVLGACGARRLAGEVLHAIAARADGVPLFLEESARMAVEAASGEDLTPQVPATLLDLLDSRLDRLGGAKQIAQVGGAIGREFPQRLLEAVLEDPASPFGPQDIGERLATLQRAGIVQARGEGDDARLAFKHALMRDAAYQSLLPRDRARLHLVIARVIRERFGELAQRQPELLALHYTEAGLDGEALRCWETAARQATSRSAHAEAIGHVNQAIAVLARTPPGKDRDRQELRLQLLLAARLIATHGYGASSVERAYVRAGELARALGDPVSLRRALLGLEGYHFMRADFARARAYVLEVASDGGAASDPMPRIQTGWALANIVMHQGEMVEAVRQMDACLALYEGAECRSDGVQDPGVMCLCYSAWSLWQMGRPDEALARANRAVGMARSSAHGFSLGEAYGFHAAIRHFRGEGEAAIRSADEAVQICEEGGYSVWLAHAHVMRGRIQVERGRAAEGIDEMHEGYEMWAATGAVVTTPFYLAMRSEGLASAGRLDESLDLLLQALAIVERTGERYYEAEIRRLLAVVTLRIATRDGLDRDAEAERGLMQARDCARARELHAFALRTAMELADFWRQRARPDRASALLRPAYDAITEGRDTRDLVAARARLEALEPGGVVLT